MGQLLMFKMPELLTHKKLQEAVFLHIRTRYCDPKLIADKFEVFAHKCKVTAVTSYPDNGTEWDV